MGFKIVNYYSSIVDDVRSGVGLRPAVEKHESLKSLLSWVSQWEVDISNVERWMRSHEYSQHHHVAEKIMAATPEIISKIEKALGWECQGELWFVPSLMTVDGFARFENGSHRIWFGVDFHEADLDYLKSLLAHEISHVYRDLQPAVWNDLGADITTMSRKEYLDLVTAEEHLFSEGIATLFSQFMFPEIPMHVHHYYLPEEMTWCLENEQIVKGLVTDCLSSDENVWKFYEEELVEGAPGRLQYFFGARKILDYCAENGINLKERMPELLGTPASQFKEFFRRKK